MWLWLMFENSFLAFDAYGILLIYSSTAQRHLKHCFWVCRPDPIMEGLVRKSVLETLSEWAVLTFIYGFGLSLIWTDLLTAVCDGCYLQWLWPVNFLSFYIIFLWKYGGKIVWYSSRVGLFFFFLSQLVAKPNVLVREMTHQQPEVSRGDGAFFSFTSRSLAGVLVFTTANVAGFWCRECFFRAYWFCFNTAPSKVSRSSVMSSFALRPG